MYLTKKNHSFSDTITTLKTTSSHQQTTCATHQVPGRDYPSTQHIQCHPNDERQRRQRQKDPEELGIRNGESELVRVVLETLEDAS